ncbi:MAG TPA: hypothetical protein VN109_04785 [Devosia sp.]|jgi:hypothetical protein|nr:hypothetical protein [Devosia sp.]
MRPFHAAAPFLTALMLAFAAAAPALAQDDTVAPPSQAAQPVTVSPAEGNWGCIALVDNSKAGLLTVFQGSYGYASATFGSSASGTGDAQMGSDGLKFLNGNLTTVGITYGLVTTDQTGNDLLTLYTADKPVLACTPR